MRYLIGIDNGGTFSKAAVFTEDGRQISAASVPSVTYAPKPGYTERDMDELWAVNAQAVREAIEKSGIDPKLIAGVSFSGHGKGLYLVGKDGRPAYRGIPSTDARAWAYIQQWQKDGTAQEVYKKTFQEILVMQPVALLAWLRDNEPQALANTRYIFAVKDYIRYKLTGEAYGEYSDFSGGNLVNLTTKDYDPELLALFGLEMCLDKLPPLRYAADLCGYVTEEASRQTGIPAGTPCAAGMFDVNACGIASGLSSPEEMCMVAGTWSINEFIAPQPITNGTVALNSMFCIPGYFLVEESSPTSAGNMEWFVRNLMGYEREEAKGGSIYDLTNQWVESIQPEDCGVIFLPFLNGSNENPLAKGTFVGLTDFHKKKHMLRAVYEGILFSHMHHIEKLMADKKDKTACVRVAGGGCGSSGWMQMFADALGSRIVTVEGEELGARGVAINNAVVQGIFSSYQDAVGKIVKIKKVYEPDMKNHEKYMKFYELYTAGYSHMQKMWKIRAKIMKE